MLTLGHGRQGDMIITSRVPWISYNWGPYGVGGNVMLAPGEAEEGWAYSEDGLRACVEAAGSLGRKIAGIIITSPDNPTGNVISAERQVRLAQEALRLGVAFVLFDWMYHFIGDHPPMDLNRFIRSFDKEERLRLMFLDGITKSLGASNTRNAHLIAGEDVIKYITAQASHSVIPSFFSMAVAMAAYEMGYEKASRLIAEPTNASRQVLREFVKTHGLKAIIGQGYYAFIHVGDWLQRKGWADSEPLGQYLAEEHGLAIVPGAFFSPYGGQWIRFSYATPTVKTLGAAKRLLEGLDALIQS
jgi:aspartate aminotransferase